MLDGIVFRGWATLAGDVQGKFSRSGVRDGIAVALAQIGIAGATKPLDDLTPEQKAEYLAAETDQCAGGGVRQRIAELVEHEMGRIGAAGANPNAAWRIDESTREMLRSDVMLRHGRGHEQ